MKITNKTRNKHFEKVLTVQLEYLIAKYGYEPDELIISRSAQDRGEVCKNTISIYIDKYETVRSVKFLLTHEYFHLVCNQHKALALYIYGTTHDISSHSEHGYSDEEFFATLMAVMEIGGCYNKTWYDKRKERQ